METPQKFDNAAKQNVVLNDAIWEDWKAGMSNTQLIIKYKLAWTTIHRKLKIYWDKYGKERNKQ